MNELEKIPEKKSKWANFQKGYNLASKDIVHLLGTNIALFICILLPIVLVGFIWTDFGTPQIGTKFVSDGIVTVVLFIIGELMMMRVGADGGKLDADYTAARKEFTDLIDKVHDVGTTFMAAFCDWQVDLEIDQATTTRLRALRFTLSDWEKVKHLSPKELKEKYGKRKAKRIMELNQLEPIELNEAILMYDSTDTLARGGVPISGEGYMTRKSHSWEMAISSIFTGLLTVSVAITLTSDMSFARVMYTAFKLVALLFRMATGYNMGAKAYNTVEVRQLQTKSNYLRQYLRFMEEKTYLRLDDKYGVSRYLDHAEEDSANTLVLEGAYGE